MEQRYYKEYLDFERYNPWYIARRELILKFLKKRKKEEIILDLGAGSGSTISYLRKKGFKNTFGVEYFKDFISYSKKSILNSSLDNIPIEDNSVDIILCLDVIEHLKDEGDAIKEMARILKKEGIAIITVPAFNELWSVHDEINQHFRRYDRKSLNKVLKKEFVITKQSYWNSFLFPAISLMKVYKRKFNSTKRRGHDFKKRSEIINFVSLWLFRLENFFISKGGYFPVGISLITIMKKK